MLLFELLTGQRPFESLTTTQELNRSVTQGDRPLVAEGNLEPAFPGMQDLMYDCWKQSAMERPSADEVHASVVSVVGVCVKLVRHTLSLYVHLLYARTHTHTHTHTHTPGGAACV